MEVWKCVKTTWRLLLLKRTLASGSMEMYEDYLEAASLEEDTLSGSAMYRNSQSSPKGWTIQKQTSGTCSSDSLHSCQCSLISESSPSLAQLSSIDYVQQLSSLYMPTM